MKQTFKRIIGVFLAALLIFTAAPFVAAAGNATFYGDVNSDGVLTPADSSLILESIVGERDIFINADVDGQNGVTTSDARQVYRASLGLISYKESGHWYTGSISEKPANSSPDISIITDWEIDEYGTVPVHIYLDDCVGLESWYLELSFDSDVFQVMESDMFYGEDLEESKTVGIANGNQSEIYSPYESVVFHAGVFTENLWTSEKWAEYSRPGHTTVVNDEHFHVSTVYLTVSNDEQFLANSLDISILAELDFGSAGTYIAESSVSREPVPTSGTCGENAMWTLDNNGLLTISGTGPMLADMSWRTVNQYNIYSVVIEDGITSIDESAFFACENLTNISIPTSVTSIDSGAFAYCRALTSIAVPDSVTHIGNDAFAYCTNLENIILSKNLTSIGRFAFSGCPITSITIPDSVTSIGTGILSETPYSANKSNWTNGLLYCGNHLIDVAYDASGEVTVKEGTLTLADASFGRNPGLVDMSIANESITSIILPDSLQYVGNYQFCDCSALQSVSFGKNTKQIGDGCFARAPELDIYYRGSSADWDKIEISYAGEHTNDLSNCTFHFTDEDPAFTNSDNAVLTDNGDLLGVADTTVQILLQQAGDGAKLYKADGTEKKADAKIGTGDKLVLSDGTEIVVSVLGDINGDGEVATADARLVLRKAVTLETFNTAQNVAANVDGSAEVGVSHARKVLRASVGLEKPSEWLAELAKQ